MPSIMATRLLVNNDWRFVRTSCLHRYGINSGSKMVSVMDAVSSFDTLGIENY